MANTRSPLLPHHQVFIDDSAISDNVAAARGYRSVTVKAELERLGFSRSQCRVPALLIPIHDVHGDIATYQLRPDEPRVRRGRPLKYETPYGSRMVLDVPTAARKYLASPSVPLIITEGARKADAAVSQGLCCIALLGVWNWRGTNEHGGKTTLPDFEAIALNGREIYLAFDSDVVTKPAVSMALNRLTDLLSSRGAHPRTILLPHGPGGVKTGLDDFLAAGNTVTDLFSRVVDQVPLPDQEQPTDTGPYRAVGGSIAYRKGIGETETWITLTNFTAEIREEVVADDGLSERGELVIAGTLWNGRHLPTARIPMSRFESLQWVTGNWGTGAILVAGMGNRDRVREAIQRLSPDVTRRREYAHPGWRQIDESWYYLSQDQVIGPDGPVMDVAVHLDGSAAGIRLPVPPGREELRTAIVTTARLLDLAPDRIMVPLLGAVFRSLLNAIAYADVAIFLVGPSGTLKSELAAVIQRFFGTSFDRLTLPASWAATPNYLERVAFDFKDCVLVIDDFAPAGTPIDVRKYHTTADRMIRGAGNASGRGRMHADGSVRPAYPPRSLILGTGEDIPTGYSIRARMVVVEVARGDVDLVLLSTFQAGDERAAPASMLAGYIQWLSRHFEQVREDLEPAVIRLRTDLHDAGSHTRTPDALASLGVGWQLWIRFAQEVGAMSRDDGVSLWNRVRSTLLEVGRLQSEHLVQENPVQRFLDLLAACLASGAAFVAGPNGTEPASPGAWGWRERTVGTGDYIRQEWQPQGRCAGWLDDSGLYLEPAAAFHAVQQFGSSSGMSLTVSAPTLWKRMDEARLLVSTELESRETRLVRKTFAGARRKTLHLRRDVLSPQTSSSDDKDRSDNPGCNDVETTGRVVKLGIEVPDEKHDQNSKPKFLHASEVGQVGRVGRAVHPVPDKQFETCVYCESRLPEGRRYVCTPCGEAFHGSAA